MTPGEKNIVRSLVAVAWADGRLESGESSVIEGLLTGFDASEAEERELLEYARTRRWVDGAGGGAVVGGAARVLLLATGALPTHADGDQSDAETEVLARLVTILGFSDAEAHAILSEADDGALALGARALEPD